MASDTAAFSMIHPHRSTEAFAALIEDWQGILASDGCGGYQRWVERRHTCLAHLIRTARSLAERMLSLKETCRLQAQSTDTGLVDAITRFFHGQQPDLSWLT
jgi:hypothetical protein